MKSLSLFILILITQNNILAQNYLGAGARIKFSNIEYHYGNSIVQTDLDYYQPSIEIIGTNTINQNKTSSKFEFGYTFEVGFSIGRFSETNTYMPVEPHWDSDTIGHRTFAKFKSRKVQFSNFLDLRFKLNKKITLISSIGFKLENREGNKRIKDSNYSTFITSNSNFHDRNSGDRLDIDVKYYINRFPLNFKLIFVPQLQIEFDEFFLKIQFYQDFLNINKHLTPLNIGGINYTTFSGLGIVISPNSTLKRRNHYIQH